MKARRVLAVVLALAMLLSVSGFTFADDEDTLVEQADAVENEIAPLSETAAEAETDGEMAEEEPAEQPVEVSLEAEETVEEDVQEEGAVLSEEAVVETVTYVGFDGAASDVSYKDGTYQATATVSPDEDEDFDAYQGTVTVTIESGKITAVSFGGNYDSDNDSYVNWALNGRTKKNTEYKSIPSQIIAANSADDIDAVSGATCVSDAIVNAVSGILSGEAAPEQTTFSVYVLMNIPYDKFYEAELNNSEKVDAVTSATLNKTRTGTLVGGSYHVDTEGSDITGITFPVKVESLEQLEKLTQITDESSVTITVTNRGSTSVTTYTSKDALFEAPSYAYYVLTEAPSYYKELTVEADGTFSFGEVKGEVTTINATAEITADTTYGDYQVSVEGLPTINTVYAVILSTDQADYGLRHLENVWRTSELAWCTGFTTAVHNSPTSSTHYVSMMGQTIQKITYITDTGIYSFATNLKVPVKFAGSVEVADAALEDGQTTITVKGLPDDFDADYQVEGMTVTVEDNVLTFEGATAGEHTLVITDKSGTYTSLSATFVLSTDEMPAAYNGDDALPALVAAEDFTQEQLEAYLANITSVNVNGTDYSATGKMATTIIMEDGSIDLEAASKNTPVFADYGSYTVTVSASGYPELTFDLVKSEYVYLYAALTWGEYWASEGVYAAGSTASSGDVDSRSESDLGAFDVVSRATANHGLHRGSFQSVAVIYDTSGNTYSVSHWTDADTAVLTDGRTLTKASDRSTGITTLTLSDGTSATMDHYEVTGIKYVPVRVATADFKEFCEQYTVARNGETLAGGYSEQNLTAYTATAAVDENTNGLKIASQNSDGSFSFSARQTGSGSGLEGTNLNGVSSDSLTVTVADTDKVGTYGEFLRVDLTGSYGDLASHMYGVVWTYYGNDSSYTTALRSFGTKFASDNWMHKSMGIQLGLTESLRCQLPEGTDGTGYWTITIYALGYADSTFRFEATDANLKASEEEEAVDTTALEALVAQAQALTESDYTAASWNDLAMELAESVELLASDSLTQAMVNEQVTHLTAAIDALVKVQTPAEATSTPAPVETENPVNTAKPVETETPVTPDEQTKLSIHEEPILTEDLLAAGMTQASVKTELSNTVIHGQIGYMAANVQVMDVELLVSHDGGLTWVAPAEEDFPATVVIPYPDNASDPTLYEYRVAHMFAQGDKAGTVEILDAEETTGGLRVTVSSFSPFAIAWKEAQTDTTPLPEETQTPVETTTPANPQNPTDTDKTGGNAAGTGNATNGQTNTNSASSIKTGDTNGTTMALYALLFLGCSAALAGVVISTRKIKGKH
jgi:uncharacterized protein with FMN-binding domain